MTPSRTSEAAPAEVWTIARVLDWATRDLKKRGLCDSPRLDCELLLGRALGVDRVKLLVDARRPLEPAELSRFRSLLLRRRSAEPIAYILGAREFHGLAFRVNRHVLIPRPDTETLVEVALARTRSRDMHGRALDLCTGSGCVAVSLAKRRPTWEVTGSDVSAEAIAVARSNALRLGAIWNVAFLVSDLFAAISRERRFDLIVANPPYLSPQDLEELSPDIRKHEPELALHGGHDGLELLRRVVVGASRHLAPGGLLAVEVGAGQAQRVAAGLAARGFSDVRVAGDYGGVERVVSGLGAARAAGSDVGPAGSPART